MSEFKRVNPTAEQRRYVLKRDGHHCRYCGCKELVKLHIDHVVPVSLGGKTILANLVVACEACNLRKGARMWTPTPLGHEWDSSDAVMGEQGSWARRKSSGSVHRPITTRTKEGRPVYSSRWPKPRSMATHGCQCSCGSVHFEVPKGRYYPAGSQPGPLDTGSRKPTREKRQYDAKRESLPRDAYALARQAREEGATPEEVRKMLRSLL